MSTHSEVEVEKEKQNKGLISDLKNYYRLKVNGSLYDDLRVAFDPVAEKFTDLNNVNWSCNAEDILLIHSKIKSQSKTNNNTINIKDESISREQLENIKKREDISENIQYNDFSKNQKNKKKTNSDGNNENNQHQDNNNQASNSNQEEDQSAKAKCELNQEEESHYSESQSNISVSKFNYSESQSNIYSESRSINSGSTFNNDESQSNYSESKSINSGSKFNYDEIQSNYLESRSINSANKFNYSESQSIYSASQSNYSESQSTQATINLVQATLSSQAQINLNKITKTKLINNLSSEEKYIKSLRDKLTFTLGKSSENISEKNPGFFNYILIDSTKYFYFTVHFTNCNKTFAILIKHSHCDGENDGLLITTDFCTDLSNLMLETYCDSFQGSYFGDKINFENYNNQFTNIKKGTLLFLESKNNRLTMDLAYQLDRSLNDHREIYRNDSKIGIACLSFTEKDFQQTAKGESIGLEKQKKREEYFNIGLGWLRQIEEKYKVKLILVNLDKKVFGMNVKDNSLSQTDFAIELERSKLQDKYLNELEIRDKKVEEEKKQMMMDFNKEREDFKKEWEDFKKEREQMNSKIEQLEKENKENKENIEICMNIINELRKEKKDSK